MNFFFSFPKIFILFPEKKFTSFLPKLMLFGSFTKFNILFPRKISFRSMKILFFGRICLCSSAKCNLVLSQNFIHSFAKLILFPPKKSRSFEKNRQVFFVPSKCYFVSSQNFISYPDKKSTSFLCKMFFCSFAKCYFIPSKMNFVPSTKVSNLFLRKNFFRSFEDFVLWTRFLWFIAKCYFDLLQNFISFHQKV